jgi:Asp-tRNA(Asn)/Glu-tRNA(Gln) amidotransferase A subunit family amidase
MANANYFSIAETLDGYRTKKLSPVEVVAAHTERAHALHGRLNAFHHLDCESAIARARTVQKELAGHAPRKLSGIPLSVKSCVDVAGWPCPAGSLLRKDNVPTTDAVLVQRLEAAGAILLGNTNTPEYLMAYETDNRVMGKTSNPWNLEYSAGGSSGGESAAIASGCTMGGVGSDGGGSVRTPAHFCGICGLKPTPGRVPATGHFPKGAGAFSWIGVVGPMARTVADLRTLFEVMAGPDAGDAMSAPVPLRMIAANELAGLRVGALESAALGNATPETIAAVRRTADILARSGFHVENFRMEKLDRALELWWYFFGPVIGGLIAEDFKGQESLLSPMLAGYLEVAGREPAPTYESFHTACTDRDLVRADILRQMKDVPVLLSPVSSKPAFRHGEGNYRQGDAHNYRDTMRYCQWLNLAGFPGLSLPMGKSPEGLPINVQLIGRPHEEELLLAVAEVIERERGTWQAPPI